MNIHFFRLLLLSVATLHPLALAQEELYLVVHNRLVRVVYYAHELAELEQLIEKEEHIHRTEQRPEPDDRFRSYASSQSFLVDYGEGLLAWSPPSSPLHSNLNNLQPAAQAAPAVITAATYPIICLQHFNYDHCSYPRCRLTHLTLEQKRAVQRLPNFRGPDGINPVICIRFTRGECRQDNCQQLHITFEPDKPWLPRRE